MTNNTEWNVSHTHTGPVSAHISSLVQRVFSVVIPCSAVSSGPGSCPVWKGTCPNSLQGSETHKAPAGYLTSSVPTHFCYTHQLFPQDHTFWQESGEFFNYSFIKKKTINSPFYCTIQITAYSLTGLVSVIWNQLSYTLMKSNDKHNFLPLYLL